jgi:hypothetical protein
MQGTDNKYHHHISYWIKKFQVKKNINKLKKNHDSHW